MQGQYKMKAKMKLAPPSSSFLDEQEQETSIIVKTLVQPYKIQKTNEKGKDMARLVNLEPHFIKI